MSVSATTEPAGPPRLVRRDRRILILLLGAGFLMSADFSILNVAIPEVGGGVGLGLDNLVWVASAYALPAAGFTLLFGRLADMLGRRRLFMAAMLLLAIGSLVGGLASSPAQLLGARALQGLSTAMAIPASLSLLTTTFTERSVRERVLGLNGALLSAGFSFGALAGGALVSAFGWRSAFLVNIPLALAIFVATPLLIAKSATSERTRLDLPGAASVTVGLLAITYGVLDHNTPVAVAGVLLLGLFWVIERRATAPLVPVRMLNRGSVTWGNYAGLVIFTMETGMIFLMTVHLQSVVGLSPFTTGLVFGIPGLVSVVAGVAAGRLIGRFTATRLLVGGMVVQALATLPLLVVGSALTTVLIALPFLFIGFFGHVTAIVCFTVTSTAGLPSHEQGLATGLVSMTQQVAITIGAPLLSAVATTQAVQTTGTHLALSLNVGFTLASAALVWLGLRRAANRTGYDVVDAPSDRVTVQAT